MGDEDTCVRVAVRIRPQIARERLEMCRVCTTVTPGEPQVTLGCDKSFTYDYVFDMDASQRLIYERCVAGLVEGSLQGYNATILAYGQTGSGKTYSMGTGFDMELHEELIGILPRAIVHLFNGIDVRCEQARERGEPQPEFKVMAQFMELYNEELFDLFDPGREYKGKGAMKIHEDPSGGIYVMGATMKPVPGAKEALELLRIGAVSRTTGSTQMNSQSSRSHAIFTLHVKQQRLVKIEDSEEGEETNGMNEFETLTAKFHFVDLAGSERLKRTGATGDRAKEGISINCGLLALGNVISALGDKSKRALHVPYRDSKLTRLLQDSLGGNSQTVMIACISPSDRDFMETLNTLNYANRARNIKNKVVVNQDKSSRTISMLRQEIQLLQMELLEYKQGKRVIGEDGEEAVNDMFHENTMLQTEINNQRTRIKALQETVDFLSAKNTQLLAEKATGAWAAPEGSGTCGITEMVQGYIKEIEDMRAKLLESEATCQQLRKTAMRPHGVMNYSAVGSLDMFSGSNSTNLLIEEVKRDMAKKAEMLASFHIPNNDEDGTEDKRNGVVDEDGNQIDVDSDTSDTEDKARENNEDDSDSETDSDDKEVAEVAEVQKEFGLKLAELQSEMKIKQQLIDQIEQSERRLNSMRQHYEDKVLQLQERIRATEQERDKMLASYSGTLNPAQDKVKRIKEEYERKLGDMQKELKRLQSAKKEHARLLQNQSRSESQLRNLRSDLAEMKRAKVKLMNKIREETQRHKQLELQRNREIAQLRKATRKHENQIRSLEAEKRVREVVIRRRNEEVSALRRGQRGNLSMKASGRLPRHVSKAAVGFSPKVAKHKWQKVEKSVSTASYNKHLVAAIEREMERQLLERERLGRVREDLEKKLNHSLRQGFNEYEVRDLQEQLTNLDANISYIQDNIKESQQNIVQVEDVKGGAIDIQEMVETMSDVEEARYLITKLYNMSVNKAFEAVMKENILKETETELHELKQQNQLQQQLLQHVTTQPELGLCPAVEQPTNSLLPSPNSSAPSTRSNSPTDNSRHSSQGLSDRTRRRRIKALDEMMYGSHPPPEDDITFSTASDSTQSDELVADSNMLQPAGKPMNRVPSAPGSLKTMSLVKPESVKPSPALPRKTYDRQDSTSPRPSRRILHTNLLGKPGSMEQGIDASPPQSPPAFRRLTSREENVFSRLTSGTASTSDLPAGKGAISAYQGKVTAKAPLVCTHIAEGHTRPVLSVAATDDLLFSASKDRTVKVWDLQTGKEQQSLGAHPNNVTVVRYHEESRLVFSVSSAYVKVWDLRESPHRCIQTLCSSGLTSPGPMALAAASHSLHLPAGESQLNDVALNHNGRVLYTAAGDRVRVWDLRRYEPTGKLSGGHQAAIMCLAVGKMSEEEDVVITGSKDHYIKVFEVNTAIGNVFTPKMNLNPPHYDGIQSLAIQGDVLFSGSRDMCIKKWDLTRQELVQSLNNAHKDWVCGLAFMPGSQILVSGCRAGILKIWSAETCTQLGEIKAHGSPINAITTNSSNIFTASNDETIRIWKRNSRYDFSSDCSGVV